MGVSQGQFIRSHLEQARAGDRTSKKFMRLAGIVRAGCFSKERVLEKVKGIADTGFLVAFARMRDRHHPWATRVAETAFHLGNAGLVLDMILEEFIALSFDCSDHLPQLANLAKRCADRQPDLADLCLIRMSELYRDHSVITVDQDFRIYRRNKREVIPLISRPRR